MREMYSILMQKAKTLVWSFENSKDAEKKEQLKNRMISASHYFDQIIFGMAPEAEETLSSKYVLIVDLLYD
jgi:hypothetical protein